MRGPMQSRSTKPGTTRRVLRLLAALMTSIALVAGSLLVAAPADAAAADQQCSYANPGSGTYAQTLCWLDMTNYEQAAATSAGGQQMQVALPGGYVLRYTITASGRAVSPSAFPTYTYSFLGRSVAGYPGGYLGVAGLPALYEVAPPGSSAVLTMNDISVVDANGNSVTAFSIVGADAEETDTNEAITYTSDKPMRQIAPIGNACDSAFTGVGTTSVRCASSSALVRTGVAMLAADSPTFLRQSISSTQRQGVAFGILMSKVVLNKVVASRVDASDSFGLTVSTADGITLATGTTGAASTGTTGPAETIGATPASPFTLAESSSKSAIAAYEQSWACTRNGAADASLPSGDAGASAQVVLGIGDLVNCTITNTARREGIQLQKIARPVTDVNLNGIRDAGDTISYSFVVTNIGQLTIDNLAVNDPAIGAVTCPVTTLVTGDSTTCTANNIYTFTAADAASGAFTNTAIATANPLGSTSSTITSNTSATTTTLTSPAPALRLDKTVSPTTAPTAGDAVSYDYAVTNTGNVAVTGLSIAETAFSGAGTAPAPTCPATSLAPGASTTCTASYTLTQADIDRGTVINTAHATADYAGTPIDSPNSTATVTSPASPALSLVKSASPNDAASFAVGEDITYSFAATNTGNVTLTDLGITEQSFTGSGGALSPVCPAAAPVPPGGQVLCTATYTVTQADVDRGEINNTATAHGTPPTGPAVDSTPSSVDNPVDANPALEITKTADRSIVGFAGDTIKYGFTVTNTGNVTLNNVAVNEESFSGANTPPTVTCPAPAPLVPGAEILCTASYTLNQADADSSELTNTATATGTPPPSAGGPITSTPSTVIIAINTSPSLSVVKTAAPLQADGSGDTITYSYTVTNTGNVTLTNIGIDETDFTGTGTPPQVSCPAGAASLNPTDTVTCTATYVVTQADADAGGIQNTATATGVPPTGGTVSSDPSTNTVPITPSPALTLVKTASLSNVTAAGQTVTYTFLVTNTGNVTLSREQVEETRFSGRGTIVAPDCPPGIDELAPGDSLTCMGVYTVTQADMDAGTIENTATATAQTPGGAMLTSPPSRIDITAQPSPSLTVEKSVTPLSITAAGQTVDYSYLIANTGNVTLTDVTATEGTFTGTGPVPVVTCPAAAASLAPAATVTCHATYTPTQDDVDRGTITNTAAAHGTAPGATSPVNSTPSSTTFSAIASPALSIVKTASPTSITSAGQAVTYSFVVTNTGNVTMSDVTVAEQTFTGTGIPPSILCPPGPITLTPKDTLTCTATYTATQADVDAGTVDNTASVSGSAPSAPNTVVDFGSSSSTVSAAAQPELTLEKSASPSDAASFVAGKVITYTFLVTNTGNVTITSIRIAETNFTGSDPFPPVICPAGAISLTPDDQVTCTAQYTLTQADIDAGGITNTATANGTPPLGGDEITSAPSTVILPHAPAPAFTLVQSAVASPTTIHYQFEITNTGNVTITDATIDESDFTGSGPFPTIICPDEANRLAPGASVVCSATYPLTSADRDTGFVRSTAVANGSALGRPITSDPSTATIAVGGLAHTGLEIDRMTWIAALLVAAGGLALGARLLWRRRRSMGRAAMPL